MLGRDARSGIANANQLVSFVIGDCSRDAYLTARKVELDRVVDKVGQNLFKTTRIGRYEEVFIDLIAQMDSALCSTVRQAVEDLSDYPAQRQPRWTDPDCT